MDQPTARPVFFSILAVVGCLLIVGTLHHPIGPHALHMVVHIAIMSVLAPLLALNMSAPRGRLSSLWTATALQLLVLWIAHVPAVSLVIQTGSAMMAIAVTTFLVVAVWFWRSVLASAPSWRAIAALLVTGKLTCLIAALLIFAPRALYGDHAGHTHHAFEGLADQQLAGLVMVTACPLSYLVAALVFAAQLVFPAVPAEQRRAGSGG